MYVSKKGFYNFDLPIVKYSVAEETDDKTDDKTEDSPDQKDKDTPADKDGNPDESKTKKDEPPKQTEAEKKLLREVMEGKEKRKQLAADNAKLQEEATAKADRLKELEDAEDARKLAKLEEKEDWDAIKVQMTEKAEQEKATAVELATKPLQEQIDLLSKDKETLESGFSKLIGDLEFSNASEFIESETTLQKKMAQRYYSDYFEVEGLAYVPYNKPRGHEGREKLVGSNGDPLGTVEALKELINNDPDKDSIWASKLKPGAGSDTEPRKGSEEKKTPTIKGQSRILAALEQSKK